MPSRQLGGHYQVVAPGAVRRSVDLPLYLCGACPASSNRFVLSTSNQLLAPNAIVFGNELTPNMITK